MSITTFTIMKKITSTGDTIVEVLISMAVVSLILSGAYATVNRTVINARQAQERGEAIKQVEGQLEKLRTLSKDPTNGVATTTSVFCVSRTTGSLQSFTAPAVNPPMPSLDIDNFANYPADCAEGTAPVNYYMSIERNNEIYTVRARWDRLGGERDEVVIVYRLYL
jgi:type II secretory pathway pseudopilin PulG